MRSCEGPFRGFGHSLGHSLRYGSLKIPRSYWRRDFPMPALSVRGNYAQTTPNYAQTLAAPPADADGSPMRAIAPGLAK
jgi:hypothetical protein